MKLRSYLILLVIAAVLPVVIFAAVMTYLSYRQQRENLADRMIERTRAISAAPRSASTLVPPWTSGTRSSADMGKLIVRLLLS